MIRDGLIKISSEYGTAKESLFKGHSLGKFIRTEFPNYLDGLLSLNNTSFKSKGSNGQSVWADVPWVAIYDSLLTSGVSKGYYVVYLFAADMTEIYLCLGQAIDSVKIEFGTKSMKQILSQRASLIRIRVPSFSDRFEYGEVNLKGKTQLAKDYELAPAFYKKYFVSDLPNENELFQDLSTMVELYSKLIVAGGVDLIDQSNEEHELGRSKISIKERKTFKEHLRIEGRVNLNLVKKFHGYDCQACGFNFQEEYGDLGSSFIEVHHEIPFSELSVGAFRELSIENDFMVLCPNCHRMIHRLDDPSNLEALKRLITRSFIRNDKTP